MVSYEMFLYKVEELDVFDVNASGDEYTDCPGDGCYKTTRDQFLLWEYTGIIPQYVELLLNVYLKYAEP